jgi:glycosyltransferase involved in cell wall biosynthesis
MPARNAGATIIESIESVLALPQTSELIVIDDCSNDLTREMVSEIKDSRVRLIGGNGTGIAAALNCGFEAARSEFVARCDADDLYPADRFDWQLEWLRRNPDFIAISGGFQSLTDKGRPVALLACDGIGREVTMSLRRGRAITTFCSWLVRRSALSAIGGARGWFETAEDLDLMFRAAYHGRVWHEPRVAYRYRLHDTSMTHSTGNNRRVFFERMAAAFAAQRGLDGTDDLERGCPPEMLNIEEQPKKSADQIEGQLIGAIWSNWNLGRRRDAISKSLESLRLRPLSGAIWRAFAVLMLKYLARR